MKIGNRLISDKAKPLIIAEIGINHQGSFQLAKKLISKAKNSGCECVKFQSHNVYEEMVKTNIKPGNSNQTIWNIIKKNEISFEQEKKLKKYAEKLGLIFLSTPFSREAADRLNSIGVKAFKIGSGECNNYPLIEHICKKNKPIILSTGMNNIKTVSKAVKIIRKYNIQYCLLQCSSIYPTPHNRVRIKSMKHLKTRFKDAKVGYSDHTLGMDALRHSISLGATIVEKHFTLDRSLKGPDMNVSMNPNELREIVIYANNVSMMNKGLEKVILKEEKPTIRFAYASVVTVCDIKKGEKLTKKNIWVKRPGTGDYLAEDFDKIIGKISTKPIISGNQIKIGDFIE